MSKFEIHTQHTVYFEVVIRIVLEGIFLCLLKERVLVNLEAPSHYCTVPFPILVCIRHASAEPTHGTEAFHQHRVSFLSFKTIELQRLRLRQKFSLGKSREKE